MTLLHLHQDDATSLAGTLTAGIGNITVTFDGVNNAKQPQALMTANGGGLTGTAPTVAVARTTAGVSATFRGASVGQLLQDTTNSVLYQNSGTSQAPNWTKVGTQS